MQDWLPIIATVIGALAAFGVWAYVSRQRLYVRAQELERTLEARTTELESARIQLQRLSTEDPLTAVANHEQFLEFLEREWRRARRDGLPLTLIFIDIDHFRAYNREFGRKAGDEVLKHVGRALAAVVGRPGDLVARYHRDEFALVLASTDGPGAFNISEHVRECIELLKMPSAKDAPSSVVTASVATATAVPQRESAWEELDLIKAARHALREARATGGNRVLRANLGMAGPPELVTR
ncbi:MAG: GGDEF domain-containing protein [Cyanobacteria bacterium]|nr:GGDEF domain-containing protein [Cyanobacteriota bacterium]